MSIGGKKVFAFVSRKYDSHELACEDVEEAIKKRLLRRRR